MTVWSERADSYRSRMMVLALFRDTEVLSRGEIMDGIRDGIHQIAYRLRAMEGEGLIRLQKRMKPGKGRSRIIGAEITAEGKKWQRLMLSEEKIAAPKKAQKMPCGQCFRVCYMASKCYLRDRCDAAVIQ